MINDFNNSKAAEAVLTSVNKFGSNAGVSTSWENVWELAATYTFLSSPGTLYMASTDNTNDLDLEITIDALDANWKPIQFVVNLHSSTSQTPVLVSSTLVMRVNRAQVTNGDVITGNVYIAREDSGTWVTGVPGTLTNTLAYIPATDQITKQAVYSVSSDEIEKLWEWWAKTITVQATDVRIQIRLFGGVFTTISDDAITQNVIGGRTWSFPWNLPMKTDVIIQARAQASTADVVAEFTTSKLSYLPWQYT